MMKKILSFASVVAFCMASFCSCANYAAYVDATMPVAATSNPIGKKVGTSSATNVLGIVFTGDAGVNKAAKDGGIKKISHVDQNSKSVLGLFTTYKTIVYGE